MDFVVFEFTFKFSSALLIFIMDVFKKRLSDDLAKKIYRFCDRGFSEREIAAKVNLSKTAIHKALTRRVHNSFEQRKCKLGRPRATTRAPDLKWKLPPKGPIFKQSLTRY